MQKLFTELIGMPVYEEYAAGRAVAHLRDVVIDPETGVVLAFVVGKNRMVVPMDVGYIGSSMLIQSRDSIVAFDEVMRVATVISQRMNLLGLRVFTEKTETYLGRVVDFVIDTNHMMLTGIHVAKLFLFFQYHQKIISSKLIVKVTREKLIVKELDVKVKAVSPQAQPVESAFPA